METMRQQREGRRKGRHKGGRGRERAAVHLELLLKQVDLLREGVNRRKESEKKVG